MGKMVLSGLFGMLGALLLVSSASAQLSVGNSFVTDGTKLYMVQPSTTLVYTVGLLGHNVTSLCRNADTGGGTALYGVDNDGSEIYQINLSTGAANPFLSTGFSPNTYLAASMTYLDGYFYVTALQDFQTGSLMHKVNASTGAVTNFGAIGIFVPGLAHDPTYGLVSLDRTVDEYILAISTSDGSLSVIAYTQDFDSPAAGDDGNGTIWSVKLVNGPNGTTSSALYTVLPWHTRFSHLRGIRHIGYKDAKSNSAHAPANAASAA